MVHGLGIPAYRRRLDQGGEVLSYPRIVESPNHTTPSGIYCAASRIFMRAADENLPTVAEVARLWIGKPKSGDFGYGKFSSAARFKPGMMRSALPL